MLKKDPNYLNAIAAIKAVDKNGKVVAQWNSNLPVLTASTLKTITCGMALAYLGEDYKFSTWLKHSGTIQDGVLYGDLNAGRLPTYHRFDIDVKRKFYFTENIMLEADLSVTNFYNRNNVFYVNMVTSQIARQLPILPTFGLTFSF